MYKYQQQRNTNFMNEDYCSYEIAKVLKTCGFNELTNSFYDEASVQGEFEIVPTYAKFNEVSNTPGCECVAAPTLSQAQKWLRSKGIEVYVLLASDNTEYEWSIYDRNVHDNIDCNRDNGYKTYEKALSAGISAALNLDFSVNSEETVISGWVARDDGERWHERELHLFTRNKPERRKLMGDWIGRPSMTLDSNLFPDLTWGDDPIEVELTIKRKNNGNNN